MKKVGRVLVGPPNFFCKERKVIEDILAQHGFMPDIDDEALGAAYESCPAVHKSVIKNALAFAHALAQTGTEPMSETRRFGHVERTVTHERLDWAFFAVDLRRFPLTAVCSAMVLAVAARVDTVVVHVTGPLPEAFLCGCDLLSVDQIFTKDAASILDVMFSAGQGIVVDLAGLDLDAPRVLRPDPDRYGVVLHVPDSEYSQAYLAVTAETLPRPRPYIAYGVAPGVAPVVMAERFLGCWVWDVLSPATFRHTTSTFV